MKKTQLKKPIILKKYHCGLKKTSIDTVKKL